MKSLPTAAILILVPLLASVARAGVAVGDVAPPIDGREFINIEPIQLSDLQGRIVLIEIFRTSSQPSVDQAAILDGLLDKYGPALTVLAVTNEDRKLVDEFVAKHRPRHPIVIESGDSAQSYGLVKGFPTVHLVGPDGKIAWTGNWADKADLNILGLMRKAKRTPRLPARFAAASDAAEAGRLMEARGTLHAELRANTLSAVEKPAVEKMIAWIDDQFTTRLAAAVAAANDGKLYESAIEFERLVKECVDHDVGKRAAEGLRQLLGDPVRKREVDAFRALAAAVEEAKSRPGKKAIPLYKAVISKWKDTKAAAKAAELIAELEKPDAGKPK